MRAQKSTCCSNGNQGAFPWLAVILLLPLLAGCHYRLNLGPPGTIGMQRSRAVLHDPYPSNELGPQILGGRPLGFDRPQAEPQDLQGSPYAAQSLNPTYPRAPVQPQIFAPAPAYPQTIPVQPGY